MQFLVAYGEEMDCGEHGYSARDGGFRFDVRGSGSASVSHPHAGDPLLIEDPVREGGEGGRERGREMAG